MTREEFEALQPGDVVCHALSAGIGYVVHANYGRRVTAVRTADLTNPDEWEIVVKRQVVARPHTTLTERGKR